jgi:hypothetical protein
MSIFGKGNVSSKLKTTKASDDLSTKSLEGSFIEFQSSVREAFQELDNNPLLSIRYIKGVVVTPAGVTFPHGLNRKWIGYIVTKRSIGAVVSDATSEDDQYFIRLISTANTTIDLMVF